MERRTVHRHPLTLAPRSQVLTATIHSPNRAPWRIGELVIHDADAKLADMVTCVIGSGSVGIDFARRAYRVGAAGLTVQGDAYHIRLDARVKPSRHWGAGRRIDAGSITLSTAPISSNAAAIRPQRQVVK